MKENKEFLNISMRVPAGLTAHFPKLTDTFKYHKKLKDIFLKKNKINNLRKNKAQTSVCVENENESVKKG